MKLADLEALRPCAAWPVVVFVLVILGAVAEAACTNGTDSVWITSQADADALISCENITADVTIQSDDLTAITLNGVRRIDGFLDAGNSTSLESISAPDLEQVNAKFWLRNLPGLSNVSFPRLETITDGVYWENLPALLHPTLKSQGVDNFNTPGINIYGDLYVKSCGLDELNAFNFGTFSRAGNIRIKDNPRLKLVNFTSLVYALDLEIMDNSPEAQVMLSGLLSVSSLNIKGAAGIDVAKLVAMDGNLNLSENSLNRFIAPELTAIGGDFIVDSNTQLSFFDLPVLETIGGSYVDGDFRVVNNPALTTLMLPKLAYIDGNTTFIGNFSSITLPDLREMSEGFHINATTNTEFNCTSFDRLSYSSDISKIPERYSCSAMPPDSDSTKDVAVHYTPPRDDSDLPRPAMAVIITISIIVALGIFGFLVRGFCRKRPVRDAEFPETVNLGFVEGWQNRRSGSEDKLPPYRRVGNPGEVPPGYDAAPGYEEAVAVPPLAVRSGRRGDGEREDRRSRTVLRLLWPRLR